MKRITAIFLISAINLFSQYYYGGSPKNIKPFTPNSKSYLYSPNYDLLKPNFAKAGYSKTYYKNGRFYSFGSGYMSYAEREKLKAIDGRYSPRIRALENQIKINNSAIKSQIYQKNPNNNAINNAINDNFRIEMQIRMAETLRNLDIQRHFK